MSQENLEIMRAALEAFNRRDGEKLSALMDDDAEIVPVRSAVDRTVFRGVDAGSQYCAAVDQTWADLRWEVDELRDGPDWVLALGHIRGRGRDSGAIIDASAGWVARFQNGMITTFQTYSDRDDALTAVAPER
jgi:ketosteroid isomerase-like protein